MTGRDMLKRTWLLVCGAVALSYAFEYDAAFTGIADNREARSGIQNAQTIFGARGTAQCGLTLDSIHRFRAGLSYLKEFGHDENGDNLGLVMYYRFRNPLNELYIGTFPREGVVDYPAFLIADSLRYYRAILEGLWYQRLFSAGYANIWIDWTARQTKTRREAFCTGFSGRLHWKSFFLAHYFLYYHVAHAKGNADGDHVEDNGGALLRLGNHFAGPGIVDSMTVSVDGLVSFNRVRTVTGWETPAGIEAAVRLHSRQFFCGASYYRGIYKDTGGWHALRWGDIFYSAQEFFEFTLGYCPIQSAHVHAEYILYFTIVGNALDSRQQFLLTMMFGNTDKRR